MPRKLLPSFFIGGFECATHRRGDGTRLDLLAATSHDRLAARDYERLSKHGLRVARDGVRWHLIERQAAVYEWGSWLPMLRAARLAGTSVIWDLCHYGWPDGLDVWSTRFVDRFADFARAVARTFRENSDDVPMFCPINEISYLAWAGGERGLMNPWGINRGPELKRQLVRAFIAAVDAIRAVDNQARIVTCEPLINVISDAEAQPMRAAAEAFRLSQFEAQDMLGGFARHLDLIGVNYYPQNQWYIEGPTIPLGHHGYRALEDMLVEVWLRYSRPLFISETGAEGSARSTWLRYVCEQARRAMRRGAMIEGICLYPVLDYPGWDNGRVCEVGLLSLPGLDDERRVAADLASELALQQRVMSMQQSEQGTVAV